jgi:hypothetical protein
VIDVADRADIHMRLYHCTSPSVARAHEPLAKRLVTRCWH